MVKKKLIRKRSNFDKNHGLTPLQNAAFFYFARASLFRSKKHSLLSRISKYASFLLFLLKKTYKKKVEFLPKTMYQPLCKMSVFLTLLELNFSGVKSIVYFPENKKTGSSWLFWLKKKIWGKGWFFDKNHGLTPLQNVYFFRLCENFTFRVQKALFSIQNIKKIFLSSFFAQKESYKKKVDFYTKTMD